jgi:hypothetical protein
VYLQSGNNTFCFSGRLGTELASGPSGGFAVGLFGAHDSQSINVGTVNASGDDTFLAVEFIGRRLFGSGLYLGGRFGVDLGSVTIGDQSVSYSANAAAIAGGPVVGFEFSIIKQLAIDIDTSWMRVGSATFNFPTIGSVTSGSTSGFLLQGGLTFNW